jgi:hypothetical protein
MKYYGIQNEVKAYINRLQAENGIIVSPSTAKTINDRVESLKRSGDWSRFSLGFNDADGDAYLTRAGVTDPLGRCEVLWFTRGAKALGVWQNMAAWSLRSYQNAGTGNTVYSLGGLGVFNGTMINAPTWERNGVRFNPNSYIDAVNYPNYPYNTGQYGLTIFSVVNPLGWLPNGTSRGLILLGASGFTGPPQLHLTNGVGGGDTMVLQKFAINYNDPSLGSGYVNNYTRAYGSNNINTNYYKNNFFFAGYSPGSTIQTCFFVNDNLTRLNGASIQPVTSFGVLPRSPIQLRIGSTSNTTSGLISISTLINIPVSIDIMQSLRNLYKSTLGSNLGLP